jgi:hypothetical protein
MKGTSIITEGVRGWVSKILVEEISLRLLNKVPGDGWICPFLAGKGNKKPG